MTYHTFRLARVYTCNRLSTVKWRTAYAQKTGAELSLLPYKSPEHTYKLNLYTQFGPPQLKCSFLNYHNKIPTCAGHQQKQYIY